MLVLPIVGEGVHIDRLVLADACVLAASHSDADNARYQGWQSPLSLPAAQCFIVAEISTEPLTLGTGVQLAIRETAGGPLVGDLYLERPTANPLAVEVGITLAPGCHGSGLATAAITAVLDVVFGDVVLSQPVDRLVAVVDVDNGRSWALFQRLGFRLEARHVRSSQRRDGTLADEVVFAMTEASWRAFRKRHPAAGQTAPDSSNG
jgi:RimJ/RimL family protein N-acetyltransferase